MADNTPRQASLLQAFIPVIILVAMLGTNVYLFGSDSLDGSNQLALLFSAAIAGVMAMRLGVNWQSVLKAMVKSISSAMSSILILLLIGALAGTWLISGIIPVMIS